MANRDWTPADDALILETVRAKGLNRSSIKELRERLKVTRHQLRNHLNTLGLTVTGRKRRDKQTTTVNTTDARVMDLEGRTRTLTKSLAAAQAQVMALQENSQVIAAMKSELERVIAPIAPLPKAHVPAGTKQVEETLVMHLSDEHGDQTVMPHRVLNLENYGFRVCLARAERYIKTTLDWTRHTLTNFRFPEVVLLCYGDHINGEIHDSTGHSYYKNAFRNALAIGQMHGLMIRDLAQHFEKVKVVCLSGNHGRRKPKKEYQGAWNNWDYLVHETARLVTADHENVEFAIPDAFSAIVNIRGYNFHVNHGDDIKSWNSIPHYGIERKTRRLSTLHALNDTKINYFVLGHFHTLSTGQHPGGETIMNGSFKATDEYALEALGAGNPPMQLIHGVHEKYGVTWRLPVHLRFKGDDKGPERYRVRLAEPL